MALHLVPDGPTPPDMLAAALAAYDAGLSVCPPRQDGTKRPMSYWKRHQSISADTAQICDWYAEPRPTGLGVITGAVSGNLEMFEFEGRAAELYDRWVDALEPDHGELVERVTFDGYQEQTPTGGRHILWRLDETPPGNTKLASGADGQVWIETRGEGGYTIVAPSHGAVHSSGQPWVWIRGSSFATIPTITMAERAILLDAARAFDELYTFANATEVLRKSMLATGEITRNGMPRLHYDPLGLDDHQWMSRAIDDYNTSMPWVAVLEPHGWEFDHHQGVEAFWRRPGKTARDGHSATTMVRTSGKDTFINFSSTAAGLGFECSPTSYDKFSVACILTHGRNDAATRLRFAQELTPRASSTNAPSWAQINAAGIVATSDEPFDPEIGDDPAIVEIDHGWQISNVAAVLEANYEPIRPTVYPRDDGVGLFYAGRLNALWGESGSFKSYLALAAAAVELKAGRTVLYVDFEDTARSAAERLRSLGVDDRAIEERFLHVNPEARWSAEAAAYIAELVTERRIGFAIIDSTGEAMALEGAKPNDDDDTARWHRALPRFLTSYGCTVVLIDHVPKNLEGKLFAIGSQRKRAAITGAAYMVEAAVSPAKGRDGYLRLTCAKDRHGTFPQGSTVADIDVTSRGGDVRLVVKAHQDVRRPTVLMERVSQFLERIGPEWASKAMCEREVQGKASVIRLALGVLVDEGFVDMEMRTGRAGGSFFKTISPFTEAQDLSWATPEEQAQPVDKSGEDD